MENKINEVVKLAQSKAPISELLRRVEHQDRNQFNSQIYHYKNWIEFVPRFSHVESDLDTVKKYSHLPVLIKLHAKNKYCPDGFPVSEKKYIKEFLSFRAVSMNTNLEAIELLQKIGHFQYLSFHGLVGCPSNNKTALNINLTNFKELETISLPIIRTKNENYDFQKCNSLKHLFWPTHYKATNNFGKDVDELRSLVTLSMHRPKYLRLMGAEVLNNLEYLEIDYAKNLADLSDLSGCASLIGLNLQNCPKIRDLGFLKNLKSLKVLQLWNCQNIESLNFLEGSNIEYLNFYSSNILDGDLSFLDSLKNLKVLRFQNKNHYNRHSKIFSHIPNFTSTNGHAWEYYMDNFV